MNDNDLATEKEAQLRKARTVLGPIMCAAAVLVFVLCFWKLQIGLLLSLLAAAATWPLMLIGVTLPVGYVLGTRAARRYKARLPGK